jgi:tetratricopeptide (TPR) repeat protein
MYFYENDLLPLLNDPVSETNKATIEKILAEAAEAFEKIDGTMAAFQAIADNPFNPPNLGRMGMYQYGSSLVTWRANVLWSAATLMLGIPALCTAENVKLSLSFLEKAGEHNWRFGYMRIGYVYSEGIPGIIPADMTKALTYFNKAHPDSNANFNSMGWCYETLGLFYTAIAQYEKTLVAQPLKEESKDKARRHIELCMDRLKALHTMGLHAPDSPREEKKEECVEQDKKRAKRGMNQ